MEFNVNDGPFTGMSGASNTSEFPEVLTYADVSEWLWQSPEHEYMLGVNGQGEPETFNLVDDSPHMFVSAAPGSGKSVIAASVATQALVKGSSVVFLDVKRISHRWAKELPAVSYAVEIDEIANVVVSVAAELRRRMRVIDDYPGAISDAPVGDRIVIVAEEINAMMAQLAEFEKLLPPRGVYRPRQALTDILNLGRAAKVHVVAFAQFPDQRLIPKAMIESFGHRILIRHTNESWKALAWQLGYSSPSPQQRGRGITVRGDRAITTQFLYLEEEQCAALVRMARGNDRRPSVRARITQKRGALRELRAVEGR